MRLVTVKLKSKSWKNGHLKGSFVVTDHLAVQIVALIARNSRTGHVVNTTPNRDKNGRFTKVSK
jgi:hypothetical protein